MKEKKSKSFVFIIILLCVIISGCATAKVDFIQRPSKNLSSYKYVVILPNSRSDYKTPYDKLTNLFMDLGFIVLDESNAKNLKDDDGLKVLFCQPEFHLFFFSIKTEYGPSSSLTYYLTLELYNIFNEKLLKIKSECNSKGQDMMYGEIKSNLSMHYSGYNPNNKIDITKKFNNIQIINKTEEQLIEYYDNNFETLNEIEGIWTESQNNQYRIGIFKDIEHINRDYVGIILDSKHLFWKPNQVKIELNKTTYKKVFTTNYFMANHSEQGTTAFINDVGLLEMELTNKGESFKSTYIKNYPLNITNSIDSDINNKTKSSGSGSIFSESGLVLTNYHVIEDRTDINVYLPQIDKEFNADLILKDKNNDLAILRLQNFIYSDIFSDKIPFSITSSSNSKLGEDVFTLGFPLGEILGKSTKFSSGKINSLFGIQDDPRVFQISNPIQPGNSGGPLFNSNGELIGVVFSSLNAKFFYENADIIPQNVNFAVKSNYLLNLISLLPEDTEISRRENSLLELPIEKQIELIQPYIVNVKAK